MDSNRLPQLLCVPPVNDSILNHIVDLIRYWVLRYFARLPIYNAESGLLSLCAVYFLLLPSDPAVTSNALAIRIIFPLIRVIPPSFRRSGLPASLGKQKTLLQRRVLIINVKVEILSL
jgi:hypothetical protein